MNGYMRRVLAAYLASAALSTSPGISASMLPAMEDFPMNLVDGIIDEVGDSEMSSDEKRKALSYIATDRRAEVRIRICEMLMNQMESRTMESFIPLLTQLSEDKDPSVRNELRRAVVATLEHADVLTRTDMVATLALSPSKNLRFILTTALKEDFFCLGVPSVLSILAEDSSVRVRRAVVDVAMSRMNENPVAYQGVLKTLMDDSRPHVRNAAKHAVVDLRHRHYGWCT
ncbi:MAG: hypothetical protein JXR76_29820 [Deltaproteobacteria bacterium]|nr:hypothetical protein [Deltaproteobacteria bacterium]